MLSDKRPEPVGDVADRSDEVLDLRPKMLIIRFPCVAVASDAPDILFQRIYLAVQIADAPLKRRDFLFVFIRDCGFSDPAYAQRYTPGAGWGYCG